jgi:ATP phosphoribosyltransferase regulatory subunit
MIRSRVQLPEGVRDIIGQEAFTKRQLETRAREIFMCCGYDEIETPTFEYATVFEEELGDLRMENMVHFFDTDGRMLTMRPDFTLPSARLVSALSSSFPVPVRVFYVGNAFGLEHNTGRQRREFSQAGAELMGFGDAPADAEIIAVADQALQRMGMDSYIFDIGHVGVFNALWKAAGLSGEQAETLRNLLNQKNTLETQALLDSYGVAPTLGSQFLALIELYGGMEVLESASEVLVEKGCAVALDELRSVCAMLTDCGLKDRIAIDLGLLTNMDYYTGTVFRALTRGVGSPLLSGGRYDDVLSTFGRPMPATGFAISISCVLSSLGGQRRCERKPRVSAIVGSPEALMGKALFYAASLRLSKQVVVTALCQTRTELLAKAHEIGADAAVFVDDSGMHVIYSREERP